MKTRIIGIKNDDKFWSDKPLQEGHPDYKNTKWYHIHWYNIPYNTVHKSVNGKYESYII